MDQKRVTVKDIAARLGVSLGIINKALNDKGGISDEMRERILTTAREMGYRVNKVAQSMARNTIVLGVLVPAQEKDYFSFLKKGLDKEFERLADYNVQCRYYPIENTYSAADTIETLKACMNDKVHGILLCEYFPSELEKIFEELEAQKIPTVLIGDTESAGNRYLSSIQVDAYRSGQMAAEMLGLCAKKDARVAILVGNKDHVEHIQKVRGFTESLSRHGLTSIGVYETYDDEEIALQIFKKIEGHLDGLYVATSTFASIENRLKNARPELRVVCTDVDTAVAEGMRAGTVQASLFQDLEKQASIAVRVLYEHIAEKKTPPKNIYVTPRLVIQSNLDTFL